MPCRFPLIAVTKSRCGADVRATQRSGKHRFETRDVCASKEYKL